MPRSTHSAQHLKRRRRGWAWISLPKLAQSTLIVIMAGWLTSIACVIAFAAYDWPRHADAIVVLGAAQYAGKPSPVLRARLDHALELWRRDTASLLVFTGGTGWGDTTSEAAVGSVYARKHGVPERAIMLENYGRTTSQSMRSVAKILQTQGTESVVLVSDPFHMFRLWILAKRMGLHAHTSPTRTSPIAASVATNARYIFSESLKAPVAFLIESR